MGLNGTVYVADSYNHKIKKINTITNTISSLYGTGKAGNSQSKSPIQFNEPGGLCISNNPDILYVADTNNHCIKSINLTKKQTYSEINFILPDNSIKSSTKLKDFIEVSANGADCLLHFNFESESSDIKITPQAPNKVIFKFSRDYVVEQPEFTNPMTIKLKIPKTKVSNDEIIIKINIVICKNNKCMPLSATLGLNVVFITNGATNVTKKLDFLMSSKELILK